MMKLDRIGNKLGLAGLVGIVLAGGMVANQMMAEQTINVANTLADRQQFINEHTLEANVGLRRMQLAVRDIRLSKTTADVEKASAGLAEMSANTIKQIDTAAQRSAKPENRERLENVSTQIKEYNKQGADQATTLLRIFELTAKRNAMSTEWRKVFDDVRGSPAVVAATNRLDIDKTLYEADSLFNAVRAATWRFASTGEEAQKKTIDVRSAGLTDALGRLRTISTDRAVIAASEQMANLAKGFGEVTAEIFKVESVRTEQAASTLTVATKSAELMRTAMSTASKAYSEAKEAASAELAHANRISLITAIAVMLAIAGSVIFSFIGVARPIGAIAEAMRKLAGGDMATTIPGTARKDEIGEMAAAVLVFKDNAIETERLRAQQVESDRLSIQQRKQDMIQLADSFEAAVGEIVDTVSSASTELEASASTLTTTATRSQELTTMVAAASEEASTNVQAVASATEELTSSVNEISRQVQESARMASEAVSQARTTNDRVGELSKAAARIGDVVELINTIAGQTNLLALNATIEAARAGEAGRGFAVVASEVKALAEQTAKATGEIGQQIASIQAATNESVSAIREISGTIEKLSEISATIASAVEEQGAATQEISRNVQQAAQGTQQVSSNITDVQRGASETGSASSQVLSAAQSLSSDSNRLKNEVGKFLNTVRAA